VLHEHSLDSGFAILLASRQFSSAWRATDPCSAAVIAGAMPGISRMLATSKKHLGQKISAPGPVAAISSA
jgi:hypothetical protein